MIVFYRMVLSISSAGIWTTYLNRPLRVRCTSHRGNSTTRRALYPTRAHWDSITIALVAWFNSVRSFDVKGIEIAYQGRY